MAKMGDGYGSEWQLTRMLGRHRRWFTDLVETACGVSGIAWLDFEFGQGDRLGDRELRSLNFLTDDSVRGAFRQWWPHGSGIMNWDAVGRGHGPDGGPSWVLVEAKGNLPELKSNCGARPDSLRKIQAALDETRSAFGVEHSGAWTESYYQHANRLAVLHFLTKHQVHSHLVDVFFYGRTLSDDRSPETAAGWEPELGARRRHLGLVGTSDLEARTHEVFVGLAGS